MKLAISVLLAIPLLASFAAPAEAPKLRNEKKKKEKPKLFQRDRGNVDSHNKQDDGATVKEQTTSDRESVNDDSVNADSHENDDAAVNRESGNIDSHKEQDDGATVKEQTTSLLQRDRESGNADSVNADSHDDAAVKEQTTSLLQRDRESHNKNDDEILAVKKEACEILNEAATSKDSTVKVLRRFVSRHKRFVGVSCVCLTILVVATSALAMSTAFASDELKEAAAEAVSSLATTLGNGSLPIVDWFINGTHPIVDIVVKNSQLCRGDEAMSWEMLQSKFAQHDSEWISTCYTNPSDLPKVPAWFWPAWDQLHK